MEEMVDFYGSAQKAMDAIWLHLTIIHVVNVIVPINLLKA